MFPKNVNEFQSDRDHGSSGVHCLAIPSREPGVRSIVEFKLPQIHCDISDEAMLLPICFHPMSELVCGTWATQYLPNVDNCWTIIAQGLPNGLDETLRTAMEYRLKFFLPSFPAFALSIHKCQIWIRAWRLSLPSLALCPVVFARDSPIILFLIYPILTSTFQRN